ncbi:MAG: sigma 54-interacting transcriptional regulator [Polyangiales bacterium]
MVRSATQTADNLTIDTRRGARPPIPGAVVVFSVDRALHAVLPPRDGAVALGRDALAPLGVADARISRSHCTCRWVGGAWAVRDEQSRNGTAVDGRACAGEALAGERCLVRLGDTLVLLVPDVAPYAERPARVEGRAVVGATMGAVYDEIRAAAEGRVLHVTGPSGAGKELAARAFHDLGDRAKGPFVAINCAAIPEGVAERVLFGARKGAYSGAHADATGHVQEADGGTLFLDEVGELDLAVQAKLLRALESGEVIPVGASRPVKVDVHFCSATHRDLRERVADKRFREDLYFRIGRPVVALPPLRERPEEVALLVERELGAAGLAAHASLVEQCLLRPWPGNVRELLVEVAAAGRAARVRGESRVRGADLSAAAGRDFAPPPPPAAAAEGPAAAAEPAATKKLPGREEIEAALRRSGGRVATAARDLGVHRNQLRRWLAAEQGELPRDGDGPDGDD